MYTSHAFPHLALWGTTYYCKVKVRLWLNSDPAFELDGSTSFENGAVDIEIAKHLKKQPKHLRAILIHEFTHVVEYLNDPSCLSAVLMDDCTALAQTMQVGMTDLITRLKVGQRKFIW